MGANAMVAKVGAVALAIAISLGSTSNANANSPPPIPMHMGCVLDAKTDSNLNFYIDHQISLLKDLYIANIKRANVQEAADVAAEPHKNIKALIRQVRDNEKQEIYKIRYFELNKMEVLKSKVQIRFTCGTAYGSSASTWAKITEDTQKIEARANSNVLQAQFNANDAMNKIYSGKI